MPTNPNDPTVLSGAPVGRAVTKLGRYTLKQRLGVGGMAEVYLAEQDGPQSFRKKVVVKRILPSLAADPSFVAMFVREAQVAARLSHGNVVQIYELGEQTEADGSIEYFIAMEYIDGLTLQRLATASWNAGKAVPIDVVIRTTADAARGLHAAHTLTDDDGKLINLVHRDISPDNLMVSKDGVTKVLDFGIAKGDLGGPKTRTGNLRGKVPYMSPEQITGQQLDGRCDLFALGVSIYWLLCGERPFDRGTDFHTMQAVLYEQPKPPSSLNPAIPKKLEKLILDLLAKDREARPKTGSLVADELEEFASPNSGAGRRTTVRFVEEHLREASGQGNPLSEAGDKTANTRPIPPPKDGIASTEVHEFPSAERALPLPQPLPSSAQRIALADIDKAESAVPRKITMSEQPPSSPAPILTEDVSQPVPVAPPKKPEVVTPKANHPVVDMLAPPKTSSGIGPALAIGAVVLVLLAGGGYGVWRVVSSLKTGGAVDAGVVAVAAADAGTKAVDAGTKAADAGSVVDAVVDAGSKIAEVVDAGAEEPAVVDAGHAPVHVAPPTHFTVKSKAPPRVQWRLADGTKLGKGSAALSVPNGTTSVFAFDPWHGDPWELPVAPGKVADFMSLPMGTLLVTQDPDAKIQIGQQRVTEEGLLPAPAGDYDVKITKGGKTSAKVFHLKAKDTLIIKP